MILASGTSSHSSLSHRTIGLLDTGATASGIRPDVVETLQLPPKGQRRVHTANGIVIAREYLMRVGFVCGDYRDPDFIADQHQPYVLEHEVLGFGLQQGFTYPVLIGMDVIGTGNLQILSDGNATFQLA